jgi:hypothetical protein
VDGQRNVKVLNRCFLYIYPTCTYTPIKSPAFNLLLFCNRMKA